MDDGDTFTIAGGNLNREFRVTFSGASGRIRAAHRNNAFAAMQFGRREDKSIIWREFEVTDPDGATQPLFVGPDKNGRQKKRERHTRFLFTALRDQLGPGSGPSRLFPNKRDGTICVGWTPLVRVTVAGGDFDTDISWNLAAVAQHNVETEPVMQKFRESCRGRMADVTWSSV